ncbi:glycosyltransferase [Nonomuraea sp. CA-141351]|uniref:glycosyltransferase n=1 Tax=Nonomuraea sp. CA-141351 TaxID=3239996 RepID=UPI003D9411E1
MIRELLAELGGARVFFAGIDDVAPIYDAAARPKGSSDRTREVVDLDRHLLEPAAEPEQASEVLVVARTPADLRRIATLHKLLPQAERVVVAVLDTPASHPAPVPTPTPAHRWRSLTDLRVYQPRNRVWVVDARFSAPTPAGRTVTATARAFAGHRLDVIAAPAAAIAGVGAADWRPGDPNATPAEVTGPVPERVGAPGSDVVLRTLGHPRAFDPDHAPTGEAAGPAPIRDAESATRSQDADSAARSQDAGATRPGAAAGARHERGEGAAGEGAFLRDDETPNRARTNDAGGAAQTVGAWGEARTNGAGATARPDDAGGTAGAAAQDNGEGALAWSDETPDPARTNNAGGAAQTEGAWGEARTNGAGATARPDGAGGTAQGNGEGALAWSDETPNPARTNDAGGPARAKSPGGGATRAGGAGGSAGAKGVHGGARAGEAARHGGATEGGDVLAGEAEVVEWAGDETPIERPTLRAVSWERLGRPGMADSPLADPDVLGEPSMIPPVDERLVNPQGFVTTPSRGMASLAERDGRWSVVLDGKVVTSFAESGGVTDADVARLRQIRGVEVDWRHAHSGPLAAVRVLAGLAAAGVPLRAEAVPRWAGALGDEIIRLIELCPDISDDLRREEHSIRLRRAALRTHGVAARWEQLGAPAPAPPLTSVLLATRRTDMVSFALDQITRQRGAQLEVILALHGVPKGHPDVAKAIAAFEGPLTVLEADRQAVFGEVLNEAAARASGSFLLKMDDDDWYGPDFLSDLLLAHSYSGAQVVGTVPEFVYLSSIDVTVHRKQVTEQITSFVAGGTILVERSAFQAVGGFRPLRRSVDTQFQEALQAAGGQIYRTHGLGYILRRGPAANHTWQEPIGTFLQRNRQQWRGFRPNALMAMDGTP